jgi:DNA-binding NarL/FixJ family response regulator
MARLADELTARQLALAKEVAKGLTNREVAAALGVSPKTVDAHLVRIYRRGGLRSRTELAARLFREGVMTGAGALLAHALEVAPI